MSEGAGVVSSAPVTVDCFLCKQKHMSTHGHVIKKCDLQLFKRISGIADDHHGKRLSCRADIRVCCRAFKDKHPVRIHDLEEWLLADDTLGTHSADSPRGGAAVSDGGPDVLTPANGVQVAGTDIWHAYSGIA